MKFRPAASSCVGQLVVLLCLYSQAFIQATRVRLDPLEEPESACIYNNYRMLFADHKYYYLKSAGLLKPSDIGPELLEDSRGPDGNFLRGNFNFNSSEHIRKSATVRWFVPLEEYTARQVYERPGDIKLASGPKVNQDLCGLHLDYMIERIAEHYTNVAKTTDLSLWYIMNSFDSPRMGLSSSNNIFLGNYDECVGNELTIIKEELDKVNKSASDAYFSQAKRELVKTTSLLKSVSKFIRDYAGPFIGLKRPIKEIRVDLYQDKLQLLPMRYCMMALRWPSWPNNTFYRRNLALRTAACLPETCDSASLSLYHDKLAKISSKVMSAYHSEFYIDHLYCLPDEESEMRNPWANTSTILLIVFNIVWVLLTIIAVSVKFGLDRAKRRAKKNGESTERYEEFLNGELWSYLSCWCILKNGRDFFVAKRGNMSAVSRAKEREISGRNKVNMDPLEGFKVLSSITVIISHSLTVTLVAVYNPNKMLWMTNYTFISSFFSLCPAVVDNFFVVTGIITAKIVFQTSRKLVRTPTFWVKFFVYRYIRIVPLYLLMHWFLKSGFRFIGSGPMWDYGTSLTSWSTMCQDESWWSVILPSANFKSPSQHCNGVGWYLASDIQFCLLTPIFVYLYIKRALYGHLAVGITSLLVAANHIRYYMGAYGDPRGTFEWSFMTLTRVSDDLTVGYTRPQYRCLSYLIGLSAGYFLDQYDRGNIKRWPNSFLVYGKAFSAFIIYLLVFLPYITSLMPMDNERVLHIAAATFEGLIHGLTSVAAAILILLLCTDHLRFISIPYSVYPLRVLANASLSTLLIHIPILFYRSQNLRRLNDMSMFYFFSATIVCCIESFAYSVILHLVYEVPIRKFFVKALIWVFSGKKKVTKPINATADIYGTNKPTDDNINGEDKKNKLKDS